MERLKIKKEIIIKKLQKKRRPFFKIYPLSQKSVRFTDIANIADAKNNTVNIDKQKNI